MTTSLSPRFKNVVGSHSAICVNHQSAMQIDKQFMYLKIVFEVKLAVRLNLKSKESINKILLKSLKGSRWRSCISFLMRVAALLQ